MKRPRGKSGHKGIRTEQTQSGKRYLVDYRVLGEGRTRSFRTLKEAKDFQATTRVNKEDLIQRERAKGPLSKFVLAYIDNDIVLKPGTKARYQSLAAHIQRSSLWTTQLLSIDRDDIQSFINELRKGGLGDSSLVKMRALLHAVFKRQVEGGKLPRNPVLGVKVPTPKQREIFVLTLSQVQAIAAEVPPRYKALIYFLVDAGARIGEASALRVRNLDLESGQVHLVENSPLVQGKKLTGTRKNGDPHDVALSAPLVRLLTEHLDAFVPVGPDGSRDLDALVFTSADGRQLRQNNFLNRVFRPACKAAGISRPSADGQVEYPFVHDLRHTAASLRIEQGFSYAEVAKVLGNGVQTVINNYVAPYAETLSTKNQAFGDALLGDLEPATDLGGAVVIDINQGKSEKSKRVS